MYSLLSRRALGCAIATFVIDRVFAVPTGVGEMPALRMLPGQELPPPEGRRENALSSGIDSALAKELATAKLCTGAPTAINPYQVAQYFDRVGRGLESPLGEDWKPYVREWPERYNPVILHFFDATSIRRPEGDCTAWCSAFVNWCIQQGRAGRPGSRQSHCDHAVSRFAEFPRLGQANLGSKPGRHRCISRCQFDEPWPRWVLLGADRRFRNRARRKSGRIGWPRSECINLLGSKLSRRTSVGAKDAQKGKFPCAALVSDGPKPPRYEQPDDQSGSDPGQAKPTDCEYQSGSDSGQAKPTDGDYQSGSDYNQAESTDYESHKCRI